MICVIYESGGRTRIIINDSARIQGAMKRDKTSILEDIGQIIAEGTSPDSTLDKIVERVAARYDIDVCSVYLLDPERNDLVLSATVGLRKDRVGIIRMGLDEGLTGLVLQTMKPLFVVKPSEHPRYKFFEESGEERYSTFLGVPLVYLQKPLGVFVVQTVREDAVTESDISVFSTMASQIAATVAYTGLLEDVKKEREEARTLKKRLAKERGHKIRKRKRKGVLRGTPVSSGFAEGYAHYWGESIGFDQIEYEGTQDIASEAQRLERAFRESREEVEAITTRIKDVSGEDEAILDAHIMSLKDKAFKKKIVANIEKGWRAEYALKTVVLEYVELFSAMDDPYLRERRADIEDIGKRVLRNLLGVRREASREFSRPTVVIASDISPVDLVGLRQEHLKAIILARGGRTSHAAILAKSFEIPMVIGVKDVLDTVKEEDFVIVDGTSGLVFSRPPQVIIDEYARLKEEKARAVHRLDALRDLRAETRDGYGVKLGANIGLLSDLELVKKYGADHIGLYRTEFPFLSRKEFPSEEEQVALYEKIVEGAEGRSVTIRTLDVGGDKFLSYLDYPREQNPYLGWRSIRVSLDLDDMFRAQIRAILRVSILDKVKMLFPMISSTKEVHKIIAIVNEEKEALKTHGVHYNEGIPLGIMVEVPGAVKILDKLLHCIDFVSIGTNDLIQYTLAVDRNNERVASLYNPLHPSVIATICEIVSICKKQHKEVSICGEAASNPFCAYLFLGMGVDRLSMNAASVPIIKDMIRRVRLADARKVLKQVLAMEDAEEIGEFLNGRVPE